jgi:hypothetical protein
LAGVKANVVVYPLQDLGAGDLSGGSIFDQFVSANGAVAAKPCLDVPQADVNAIAQPGFGLRSWHGRHIQYLPVSAQQ